MQSVTFQTKLILTGVASHSSRITEVPGERLSSVQATSSSFSATRNIECLCASGMCCDEASRSLLVSITPQAKGLEETKTGPHTRNCSWGARTFLKMVWRIRPLERFNKE